MNGTTFEELLEKLEHLHEVEFKYMAETYMIQPENDNGTWLTVWKCTDNPKCLFRLGIPEHGDIPKSSIDVLLSEKCFSGKSFFEIEKEVEVIVIY